MSGISADLTPCDAAAKAPSASGAVEKVWWGRRQSFHERRGVSGGGNPNDIHARVCSRATSIAPNG